MESQNNLSFTQKWYLAIRPKTLPAALAPVLAGSGIAIGAGTFKPAPVLVAAICSVLLQIGANLANDVSDYQKGTDTGERLGPLRVTQAGLLSPHQVWLGTALAFFMAALGGVYLATVAGMPVIYIGLACILAAYFYTSGPMPLSDVGLGDLFVMIFFGFAGVCGMAFVLLGYVPDSAWLAALGVGAMTVNLLVVNNVRDIETDRRAGRRNIPVVWGKAAGELEYALMLVMAYLCPVVLLALGWAELPVLISWLSLPLALVLMRDLHIMQPGRAMNVLLARTANQLLLYSLLLGVGFALS